MDWETITLIEDGSCVQCGGEMSKGQEAVHDKMSGAIFCGEEHWAIYYDVDGAASIDRRHRRQDEAEDED